MADQNLAALPWKILSIIKHGTGTATKYVPNRSILHTSPPFLPTPLPPHSSSRQGPALIHASHFRRHFSGELRWPFVDSLHTLLPLPKPIYLAKRVHQNFRISNGAGTCMQVMEHGDHAMFLGHGCSATVSVRRFPQLTRDAVYFTHVYYRLDLVAEGGERIAVALNQGAFFQNKVSAGTMSESIRVFDVENSQVSGLWNGRRPFWVAPEINRDVL